MSLAIDSLWKSFGDETVLEDVSFEVDPGEICVVLGPSGGGKTTIMRCIAGLEEYERGQIAIDGASVDDVPTERRNIGYVFQEFEETLFPHMTVRQNVAFGLQQQEDVTVEAAEERIDEILEMLSIPETADDYPKNLSGGQQQRVELARQLVRDCDVMLFDNPLGDLDYKLQKYMEIELRRIHRDDGGVYLYVTHDQDEAMTLADKVVVLNAGRIEQVGTPEEVYADPKTAFVGRFVGDTNHLVGEVVERSDEGVVVETDVGRVEARVRGDPEESARCVVLFRPEKVVVDGDAESMDNTFEGTVTASSYTGEETELIVEVADDVEFQVKIPDEVSDVDEDQSVVLGCPTDGLLAFGADDVSVDETMTIEDVVDELN